MERLRVVREEIPRANETQIKEDIALTELYANSLFGPENEKEINAGGVRLEKARRRYAALLKKKKKI